MRVVIALVVVACSLVFATAISAHRLPADVAREAARAEARQVAKAAVSGTSAPVPHVAIIRCHRVSNHTVDCTARYRSAPTKKHGQITCFQVIRVRYLSRSSTRTTATPSVHVDPCVEVGDPIA